MTGRGAELLADRSVELGTRRATPRPTYRPTRTKQTQIGTDRRALETQGGKKKEKENTGELSSAITVEVTRSGSPGLGMD